MHVLEENRTENRRMKNVALKRMDNIGIVVEELGAAIEGKTLLPAKTSAFIDFVVEWFQRERYPERFAGSIR
jgi:hypothetical protein